MEKILIVEDNRDMQFLLSSILKNEGYETAITGDGNNALKELKKWSPDLVLLDIKLPGINGMQVLQEMKRINEDSAVIMLTAFGDIRGAVESMKLGAFEYITKPFDNDELFLVIKRALHMRFLNKEVTILRKQLNEKTADDIIEKLAGKSPQMKQVLTQVDIVAPTGMTVLIQGESGTGKELIAELIHQKSERHKKAFVEIDCGAIPDTLIESELFGYEKGAFTGADAMREGRFEQANSGTMFLDEITNLPDVAQAKFLRVIQEKRLQHLGGKKDIKIDVRIVAATNVDFSDILKTGRFRNDLFHRINEFPIMLPSLRERKEDILFLANHFLEESSLEFNKNIKGFSTEVMEHLFNYNWPGNVRELKNFVKRAALMANADYISMEHLASCKDFPANKESLSEKSDYVKELQRGISLNKIGKKVIDDIRRDIIKQALIQTDGNKAKAARMLKIDRATLYSKIKKYQIE
jgi:DNA-binding NtrC family response regulator